MCAATITRWTREVLRLKWQQGRSHREIATALAIGTPSNVLAERPTLAMVPFAIHG
jgi:hypothetical protein